MVSHLHRAPWAVVVDLDDTLYPQSAYLAGAAAAVGAAAAAAGLDGPAVHRALDAELAAGSDTGGTIDRALLAAGVVAEDVGEHVPALVAAFVAHRPASLPLHPGVVEALHALRAVAPLGCLTDGDPRTQDAKLAATGVLPLLHEVVVTDALGSRAVRKPHPAGLLELARRLGVPADRVLVIGDRPDKDVAVAAAVGAPAIRVRQGEHAHRVDGPTPWRTVDSFPEAAAAALGALHAAGGLTPSA
ncbi:putative hydrolase of the HAD superfamily [Klenkia marina]|uniref:Putative hydrolase of the HAD superfamily n=1 Tax=Klenkia marina TaxID=1960309 RepID=A0A1G4X9I5_9ACTN|nr:putative hydrolase of the HAD superfamily [Klenkia marina]